MGTSHCRLGLVVVAVLGAALGAAGCAGAGGSTPTDTGRTTTTSESARLAKAEFAAQADLICIEVASHFSELSDPDGVGGAKPIGLGGFMRAWVAKLRVLDPPPDIAADWIAGLDLLDRAADQLDAAEAGEAEGQSKALWNLEPRAQKHFDAMHVPFQACFVE